MSGHDHNHHDEEKGVSRRKVLECMTWAGTGVLWTLNAGVLSSRALGQAMDARALPALPGTLNFVQISDSHIGFHKPANPDVAATFRETVARINAAPPTLPSRLPKAPSQLFLGLTLGASLCFPK